MLIIYVFLFINIIKGDVTDGKYIDLLPEKEKTHFLDQIARRILEEVESNEKTKGSTELTDDQLNKHDEYVRQILHEESKNMRKHDKDEKDSEKVIPLNKNGGEDRYIDLTLRTNGKKSRRVFDGFVDDDNTNDDDDDTQINDHIEQSDADIQVKNFVPLDHNKPDFHLDIEKHSNVTESVPNVDDMPDLITEQNTEKLKLNDNLENNGDDVQKSAEKSSDIKEEKVTDNIENTTKLNNNSAESVTLLSYTEKVVDDGSDSKDNNNDSAKNIYFNVNSEDKVTDHTDIEREFSFNTENETISNTEKVIDNFEDKDKKRDVEKGSVGNKISKFYREESFTGTTEYDNNTEDKEVINYTEKENNNSEHAEINKAVKDVVKEVTKVTEFDYTTTSKREIINDIIKNVNDDSEDKIKNKVINNITKDKSNKPKEFKSYPESFSDIDTSVGKEEAQNNPKDDIVNKDFEENDNKIVITTEVTTNIPYVLTTTGKIQEINDFKPPNSNSFEKALEIVKNNTKADINGEHINETSLRSLEKLLENLNKSDNIKNTEEKKEKERDNITDEKKGMKNITKENKDSKIINIEISTINNTDAEFTTEKPYILRTLLNSNENKDYENTKTTKQLKIEPLTPTLPTKNNNFKNKLTNANYKNTGEIDKENNIKMKNIEKLINNTISKLRYTLLNKKAHKDTEIRPFYEANKNKTYIVYEIPANVSPFVKKVTEPINIPQNANEEKYYVPVYNYSPNNAYYNAHHLSESNDKEINENNDENEQFLDKNDELRTGNQDNIHWDYFFSANYHRKFRFGSKIRHKNQEKKVTVTTAKNYTSNLNNFIDYDIDYIHNDDRNNLRSLCDSCKKPIIENSEEIESEEVQKGFVNNLKSIRQFLMEKQSLFVTPYWDNKKKMEEHTTPKEVQDENEEDKEEEREEETEKKTSKRKNKAKDLTRSRNNLRTSEAKSNYRLINILNNNDIPKYVYIMPSESHIRKRALDDFLKKCPKNDTFCALFSGMKLDPKQTEKFNKSFEEYKKSLIIHEISKPDTGIKKGVLRTGDKESKNKILKQEKKAKNDTQSEEDSNNQNKKNDYEFMRKILSIVDGADVMTTFEKLSSLNNRRKEKSGNVEKVMRDVNIYVNVVQEMIKNNSKGLIQFNWLESAVNLQSALQKMNQMVDTIRHEEDIHPSDFELLKYLIYLHKTAKQDLQLEGKLPDVRIKPLLPRNMKKNKIHKIITDRGLIQNRYWLKRTEKQIPSAELEGFQQFLDDFEAALSDLHTALKYISMVTKYKNQNWFKNLKELNVFGRKQALELLVHIFGTRLLVLIENSARNGLENDFIYYVRNNLDEVTTTAKEFVFILELLEELKYLE